MPKNISEKLNSLQIRLRAITDHDPLKIDDTGEGRWMTILISVFVILIGAVLVHYLLFVKTERSIDIGTSAVSPETTTLDTVGLKKVNEYYNNRSTEYGRSVSSPGQFVDPSL
ncbi:MAG: hypothetical protein HZA95_03820 [Candidatus Vogelbacteria bacterium]|nr:hypothetical protein [Candidatus Vogelbacteria bacterium]